MTLVLHGLSTDVKPLDVPAGSLFYTSDDHHKFEFDGATWADLGDPGQPDFTETIVGA